MWAGLPPDVERCSKQPGGSLWLALYAAKTTVRGVLELWIGSLNLLSSVAVWAGAVLFRTTALAVTAAPALSSGTAAARAEERTALAPHPIICDMCVECCLRITQQRSDGVGGKK